MKQIYSFFLMLFISIAALAADRPRTSRLTITTSDNDNIRVEIDGRKYREGDNSIRINNINPGYHTIKVYRPQSTGGLFGGRNRERLVYSNSVYMKPEVQVDIWIDRNGRAQVKEFDLNRRDDRKDNDRNRKNDNGSWGNDNGRWDDYDGYDRNDRNDDRNNNGKWDEPYNSGNSGRAVSYSTFESMKQQLRRENFENTRMTLAKQMLDRNAFETSQVKEMLQMFSFESNRLDLAKYAYRTTTDKRNYYSVNDVFSFSSSRDELSRFINNYR